MSRPYPTPQEAIDSAKIILSKFTGAHVDAKTLAHEFLVVADYAASMIPAGPVPHMATQWPDEQAALRAHLEDMVATGPEHHKMAASAINWQNLLALLLKVLPIFLAQA